MLGFPMETICQQVTLDYWVKTVLSLTVEICRGDDCSTFQPAESAESAAIICWSQEPKLNWSYLPYIIIYIY